MPTIGFACGGTCLPLKTKSGGKTKCNYQPTPPEEEKIKTLAQKGKGKTPKTPTTKEDSTETQSKGKGKGSKTAPAKDGVKKTSKGKVKSDATAPVPKNNANSQSDSKSELSSSSHPEKKPQLLEASFVGKYSKQLEEDWSEQVLINYKNSEGNPRLRDNAEVIEAIKESASVLNFVGVKDDKGRLQAAAVVEEEKDSLYIELLATAPWNLLENDERKVKGAGTTAMQIIARQAKARGYDKLTLLSETGAVSFYEKLGFKKVGEPSKMELSGDALDKFANGRQIA